MDHKDGNTEARRPAEDAESQKEPFSLEKLLPETMPDAEEVIIVPPETAQEREARYARIMASPEFPIAVKVALKLFAPFIAYEVDAPEEARIMLFPAFMHITRVEVNIEIGSIYAPGVEPPPVSIGPLGWYGMDALAQIEIVRNGISDAISILKLRTDGAFPIPGSRPLKDYEYTALSDLAWIEAALFYRITEKDKTVGFIDVTTIHKMRASKPVKSRFRTWLTVDKVAVEYVDVLSNPDVDDMVTALIDKANELNNGHGQYFLRWREAELI